MNLNEKQRAAFNLAVEGHNLLISGQCGTGKTHLLRHIIQHMRASKKVAVTSTTGIASTVLGLTATTLHHWSGVGDGRFTEVELRQLYMTDDRYADARRRVAEADVLVIDEVGMLSETLFDKVELICRLGRGSSLHFGGLQVIASGDFKQLPPVPHYRYSDPGNYSFVSRFFNYVLPHRINLTEVVRQNEVQLVRTVNQLCDGNPDLRTETFLRSLNRPLPDGSDVCRLFGTKFDAVYVNQTMLDDAPGEMFTFRAKDEGKRQLLRNCEADNTLVLKVGAPVILIRNLRTGLFNGTRGRVHSLEPNKDPVIEFSGRLCSIGQCRFDIYDPERKTVLAARTQYPLKLAYGLTVHRAQGQTCRMVEIDCFSFFAPGQMGVAVGRAVHTTGLRIINYNSAAAHLKHPQIVYDFYYYPSAAPKADLSCCRDSNIEDNTDDQDKPDDKPEDKPDDKLDEIGPGGDALPSVSVDSEVECPWTLNEFLLSHDSSTFLPESLTGEFILMLEKYAKYLYGKVKVMQNRKRKTNEDFTSLYTDAYAFLTSAEHSAASATLRESNKPQKLSSKLFLWLVEKEVKKEAETIVAKEESELHETPEESIKALSAAALAKIRYITGACIHKIITRLRAVLWRNIGKAGPKNKADRKWSFHLHRLLKGLRIPEETAIQSTECQESLFEIEYRQGPSRGLTHVSDQVFDFFSHVHVYIQRFLSAKAFHIFNNQIHLVCRQKLQTSEALLEEWHGLFTSGPGDDDSTFEMMVDELYGLVTEHYLRISIAEGLHTFKSSIPKTKKQALRSKVTALGERESKKKRTDEKIAEEEGYFCPICKTVCEDDPAKSEDNSIGCDACNRWHHFKCAKLTGKESFLRSNNSTWKCPGCSSKGKGRTKKP